MTWKVNGTSLDIGTTKVLMEMGSLTLQEALRVQKKGVLHGRQRRHRLGVNLPVLRFRFWFYGVAPDRYAVMQRLRTDLKRAENFVLEAPAGPNELYFEGGVKTIRLACEDMAVVYENGTSRVGLDVFATHLEPEAGELLGLSNLQLAGAPTITLSKTSFLVVTTALNKTATATPHASVELIIITPLQANVNIVATGLSNGIFRMKMLTPTATGLSNGIMRSATVPVAAAGGFVPIIETQPQAAPDSDGRLSGMNTFPFIGVTGDGPSNTPTLTVT